LFQEYNPNLAEVSTATRQAYVKFMVPIIKKNFGEDTSGFEERAAKRASQKSTKSMTDLVGDYSF
jgi:dihydroxyacetone kinase